jgi:transcriptional regulator with XRE-family HTH domain
MIKEIREFYGIPQQLLADYLLITRSHLSMAEIGKRDIKTSASLRLLKFYQAMQPAAAKAEAKKITDLSATQNSKMASFAKKRLRGNDIALSVVQEALVKMKEDHLKATHVLNSLAALKAKAEPGDESLVEFIRITAETLFKKTSGDAQLKLELRLQAITAENDFLQNKMEIQDSDG